MNKTSTVVLVSAAVVAGLVISVFAFVAVTPYGHMLFSVPWWGYMTDSGHMGGDYETTGHHHADGPNRYDCPRAGYWRTPGGPHMMGGSNSTGGYGPTHRAGMMSSSGTMKGPDTR